MKLSEAIRPLYVAVYAKLSALEEGSPSIGVGESVAPDTTLPFVRYSLNFNTDTERRAEAALQVEVFSNGEVEEVLDIFHTIGGLLDRERLSFDGGHAVAIINSVPSIGRDEDGTTRHGVQTYRVLVHI